MTLEPGRLLPGSDTLMLVHEEPILVTDSGAEWLADRAPKKMRAILDGDILGAYSVYQEFEKVALLYSSLQ